MKILVNANLHFIFPFITQLHLRVCENAVFVKIDKNNNVVEAGFTI